MKKLKTYAFAALAVIQLAVAANMVIQSESVFSQGKLYKFRCMPVDPYDAFRGRYVSVGIDRNFVDYYGSGKPLFAQGQEVYGTLVTENDGYTRVSNLYPEKPGGMDFIKLRFSYYYEWNNRIYFEFPVTRYYMNEDAAPKAESAYWSTWRTRQTVYMEVMIKDGAAVMKGLYIDGVPIEEVIKK